MVTLDLPGHGDSPALRHPVRLHQLGALFHETLAKFLISEYCVLGWSMGGMIAPAYELDFPGLSKIILVGSTPQFVATANFPHAVRPGGHAKLKQQLQKDITQGLAEFLKFATRDHVRGMIIPNLWSRSALTVMWSKIQFCITWMPCGDLPDNPRNCKRLPAPAL